MDDALAMDGLVGIVAQALRRELWRQLAIQRHGQGLTIDVERCARVMLAASRDCPSDPPPVPLLHERLAMVVERGVGSRR